MNRRGFITGLAAISAGGAFAQTAPQAAAPLIYYAGQAGRLTSDRDKAGGNPFATAFCEVIAMKPLTLRKFTEQMAYFNAIRSRGWQQMDYPRVLPEPKRRLDKGEHRVALVLINADYSKSDAYSLPGARFDAKRVPAALTEAGFDTTVVLDATASDARMKLAEFAQTSASAETSIVYIGGHGAQRSRDVFWLAGDFPGREAKWLDDHAITVAEIAKAGQASGLNLVLYASCRDNPFL